MIDVFFTKQENRMITASCKRAAVYCSKYLPELDKDDEVLDAEEKQYRRAMSMMGRLRKEMARAERDSNVANEDTISN